MLFVSVVYHGLTATLSKMYENEPHLNRTSLACSLSSLKDNDLNDEAKQIVTEAAKARGVALEM